MRVLVAVASKHGSTAEIGEEIARQLRECGDAVECRAPESVAGVDSYDAVILGAAIYADEWIPTATTFAERFAGDLAERTVFVFASGPTVHVSEETELPPQVGAICDSLGAVSTRVFGGKVDRSQLGSVERAVLRMRGAREGDFRDLGEARRWAKTISEHLHLAPVG